MNHNKHEAQAVAEAIEAGEITIADVFLAVPDIDYMTFELFFQLKSEVALQVENKLAVVCHGAALKEPIETTCALEVNDVSAYLNSSESEKVFGCMEDVYQEFGFDGPGENAQIMANAINNEIYTARWAIQKDKKLSKKQKIQVENFMFGDCDIRKHQVIALEYGGSAVEIVSGGFKVEFNH